MSESNSNNTSTTRKLPRSLRKANLMYKLIMGFITGANIFLLALNNSSEITIPAIYFEVVSVLATSFPIIWSKILDSCKEYEGELTPESTPELSSPNTTVAISEE